MIKLLPSSIGREDFVGRSSWMGGFAGTWVSVTKLSEVSWEGLIPPWVKRFASVSLWLIVLRVTMTKRIFFLVAFDGTV